MPFNTADFRDLYACITRNIGGLLTEWNAFHAPYRLEHKLLNPLTSWLRYLIEAFAQQFADWERDGGLKSYLEGLETWRNRPVHPAFRLAGHVYLHIGYDLPRAIGVTLRAPVASMQVPPGSPTFTQPNPVYLDRGHRWQGRMAFLEATPQFERTLLSEEGIAALSRARLPVRWLSIFGAPRQQTALIIMAQWAIALRGAAWIHGEALADMPGSEVKPHVIRLRHAIEEALEAVTSRSRLMDMRPFPVPTLLQIGPPLLLLQLGAGAGAVAIALLVILVLQLLRDRRRRLAAAVDALGREIYRRLGEILPDRTGGSETGQRSE